MRILCKHEVPLNKINVEHVKGYKCVKNWGTFYLSKPALCMFKDTEACFYFEKAKTCQNTQ